LQPFPMNQKPYGCVINQHTETLCKAISELSVPDQPVNVIKSLPEFAQQNEGCIRSIAMSILNNMNMETNQVQRCNIQVFFLRPLIPHWHIDKNILLTMTIPVIDNQTEYIGSQYRKSEQNRNQKTTREASVWDYWPFFTPDSEIVTTKEYKPGTIFWHLGNVQHRTPLHYWFSKGRKDAVLVITLTSPVS